MKAIYFVQTYCKLDRNESILQESQLLYGLKNNIL